MKNLINIENIRGNLHNISEFVKLMCNENNEFTVNSFNLSLVDYDLLSSIFIVCKSVDVDKFTLHSIINTSISIVNNKRFDVKTEYYETVFLIEKMLNNVNCSDVLFWERCGFVFDEETNSVKFEDFIPIKLNIN